MNHRSKCKTENNKTSRRKHKKKIPCDFGLGKDFLARKPKA